MMTKYKYLLTYCVTLSEVFELDLKGHGLFKLKTGNSVTFKEASNNINSNILRTLSIFCCNKMNSNF